MLNVYVEVNNGEVYVYVDSNIYLPQYQDAKYDHWERVAFQHHRTRVAPISICSHTMTVRPTDLWSLFDFSN